MDKEEVGEEPERSDNRETDEAITKITIDKNVDEKKRSRKVPGILSKVQKAKETSDGNVGFLTTLTKMCCGSYVCFFAQLVCGAIPASMIAMGTMHLKKCPVEPLIPIYLLVGGCFSSLAILLRFSQCGLSKIRKTCKEQIEQTEDYVGVSRGGCADCCSCIFVSVIPIFMLAWFIAGNVWIYRTYNIYNGEDPESKNYCYSVLYLYAFWLTTATYIFIGVVILLACCCSAFVACCCRSAFKSLAAVIDGAGDGDGENETEKL